MISPSAVGTERRRLWIGALLSASLWLIFSATVTIAAQNFGPPVSGESVYDSARALSSSEHASVEQAVTNLADQGTPTIVYLRVQPATPASTQADAAELMDAWNVQSKPGARDGIVLFVNLSPSDPRHGDAAIYAGQRLLAGPLPEPELQRIVQIEMAPQLSSSQLGQALVDGLNAVRLRISAQPLSPNQGPNVGDIGGFWRDPAVRLCIAVGINAAGLILLILAIPWIRREWDRRPHRRTGGYPQRTFDGPPGRLAPAMAGALVMQELDDSLMVATVLELARHGDVSLDRRTDGGFRLRLIQEPERAAPFEKKLWSALESGAVQRIIEAANIAELVLAWRPALQELRAELQRRGWFQADDPNLPWINRWSTAGYVLAFAASGAAIGSAQPAAIPGIVLLYGVATVATLLGLTTPALTSEGAAEAAPWRAYRNWLVHAAHDLTIPLKIERDLQYAVAFGLGRAFDRRIAAEDEAGRLPEWLASALPKGRGDGAWITWWDGSFGAYGSSSTSWSGVSGGGGAAAGGGGAATGF